MSTEARVWVARLQPPPDRLATLAGHLSPAEVARGDRFHRREERDRFVAARGLLRELLASETGIDAAALDIAAREDGKPVLCDDRDVRFNLSHSGELAVFVVARDREVGVDVERVRADADLQALAARVLAPTGLERWSGLPAGERRAAFFTAWTRKEAYVKARGVGLALELERIEIGPEGPAGEGLRVREDGVEQPWRVRDLDVEAGYVAAVSAQGEGWVLQVRRL